MSGYSDIFILEGSSDQACVSLAEAAASCAPSEDILELGTMYLAHDRDLRAWTPPSVVVVAVFILRALRATLSTVRKNRYSATPASSY